MGPAQSRLHLRPIRATPNALELAATHLVKNSNPASTPSSLPGGTGRHLRSSISRCSRPATTSSSPPASTIEPQAHHGSSLAFGRHRHVYDPLIGAGNSALSRKIPVIWTEISRLNHHEVFRHPSHCRRQLTRATSKFVTTTPGPPVCSSERLRSWRRRHHASRHNTSRTQRHAARLGHRSR